MIKALVLLFDVPGTLQFTRWNPFGLFRHIDAHLLMWFAGWVLMMGALLCEA